MEEYKVWAYARSAAPNLTALENQLEEVMREADKRGYILVILLPLTAAAFLLQCL